MSQFYFIMHGKQSLDGIKKYKLKGQGIDLMSLIKAEILHCSILEYDI